MTDGVWNSVHMIHISTEACAKLNIRNTWFHLVTDQINHHISRTADWDLRCGLRSDFSQKSARFNLKIMSHCDFFLQLDSTVCKEMSVSDTEVSDVTWTDNGTFNLSEGHTPQTENSDGTFVTSTASWRWTRGYIKEMLHFLWLTDCSTKHQKMVTDYRSGSLQTP